MNGIDEVIKSAGSVAQLARETGLTYQAIDQWVRNGEIPARRFKMLKERYGISYDVLATPKKI